MKKLFIVIISVIISMSLISCGEKREETEINNNSDKKHEVKENNIDLSKSELNQENVDKLLKQTLGKTQVKIKAVNVNGHDINIQLFQEPEDEKQFLIHTSNYFINIINELFKNNDVTNIEFSVDSTFDDNQNEKIESRAINYKINREKYNEINWEDIEFKIYSEPEILYNVLDSALIHPSIINNIKK